MLEETANHMGNKILLTGNPGCGKTTVIRRVVERYSGKAGGFYTQEIREAGIRKGFEIITLDGGYGILAHVDMRSPHRVGKYGLDLACLERLAVVAIQRAIQSQVLVVIDEIGPMEIRSMAFRQAVRQALQNSTPVLSTIVKRSTPFGDEMKRVPKVQIFEVTPLNRELLVEHILELLMSNYTNTASR